MCVNAWKVVSWALATLKCKKRRHLAQRATCRICGKEDKDAYHALVTCDNATILWNSMNKVWHILKKEQVLHTGHEWLLNCLLLYSLDVRNMLLMLIWRIWNLRNNLMHGKEVPPVEVSKNFLCTYLSSIHNIKNLSIEEIIKGKSTVVDVGPTQVARPPPSAPPWLPPPTDWLALSVGRWLF